MDNEPFKLPNFVINGNELVFMFDSHGAALTGQRMIRDAVRQDAVNAGILLALEHIAAVGIHEIHDWKQVVRRMQSELHHLIASIKGEA